MDGKLLEVRAQQDIEKPGGKSDGPGLALVSQDGGNPEVGDCSCLSFKRNR